MRPRRAAAEVAGRRWLGALALVLLPGLVAAEQADDDPRVLLERMERAVETLNYEGTFVHIVEGRADTMYVVHRYQDGKSTERLIALDGPGREIIRDDDEVTCIFGDRQSVLVERRSEDGPLRSALPRYSEELDAFYEFARLRSEKKVGRSAEVIAIRPRDDLRYGYKLWMDSATGMMLKAQLMDAYGEIVEQLLFVSIELPEEIPAAKLEPTLSTEGFTWYVQDERTRAAERTGGSAWRAVETPAGFRLEVANVKMMAGAERAVEHLVYSDGVASVSVFVEPAGARKDSLDGASRIGAANAYTAEVDGHQVTAVGEVPAETVRMIARSMQRQSSAVAAQ